MLILASSISRFFAREMRNRIGVKLIRNPTSVVTELGRKVVTENAVFAVFCAIFGNFDPA